MNNYLEPDDPGAFTDWPLEKPPVQWHPEATIPCPVCQERGGWNLQLNAYPLHGKPDTPENRHNFAHFRCHCAQCNGYGWAEPRNAGCVHDYGRELSLRSQ